MSTWHIPEGGWYAVENSPYGIELAEKAGYSWIDMDCHITKDGVWVFGHDRNPKDDRFIIPAAIATKYGTSSPTIENMTWSDLKTLRTPATTVAGQSVTLRYYTLEEIFAKLAQHPKMSIAFELKNSLAFDDPAQGKQVVAMCDKYGITAERIAFMSIAWPEYNHLARFRGVHSWFKTVILPYGLVKPPGWAQAEPYVDHYRGVWKTT